MHSSLQIALLLEELCIVYLCQFVFWRPCWHIRLLAFSTFVHVEYVTEMEVKGFEAVLESYLLLNIYDLCISLNSAAFLTIFRHHYNLFLRTMASWPTSCMFSIPTGITKWTQTQEAVSFFSWQGKKAQRRLLVLLILHKPPGEWFIGLLNYNYNILETEASCGLEVHGPTFDKGFVSWCLWSDGSSVGKDWTSHVVCPHTAQNILWIVWKVNVMDCHISFLNRGVVLYTPFISNSNTVGNQWTRLTVKSSHLFGLWSRHSPKRCDDFTVCFWPLWPIYATGCLNYGFLPPPLRNSFNNACTVVRKVADPCPRALTVAIQAIHVFTFFF